MEARRKERQVQARTGQAVKGKLFYKWFQRYFIEVERWMKVYHRVLKRKALALLRLNMRKAILKSSKAV
jgi:hypothetical protein